MSVRRAKVLALITWDLISRHCTDGSGAASLTKPKDTSHLKSDCSLPLLGPSAFPLVSSGELSSPCKLFVRLADSCIPSGLRGRVAELTGWLLSSPRPSLVSELPAYSIPSSTILPTRTPLRRRVFWLRYVSVRVLSRAESPAYLCFIPQNDFIRSAFGAGMPLAAHGLFVNLKVDWGTSLLGFVSLLFLPLPFFLYFVSH
jgi:hypothetical protein